MKFSPAGWFGSECGFTLAEMLVALGLATTTIAIMVGFLINFTRASTYQNAAAGAQQVVRAGINYIAYDIHMAGMDPLNTAGARIEEISSSGNKLRFSSDRCNLPITSSGCRNPEPDGDLDDDSEIVTYFYDARKRVLRRCLYETPSTFGLDAASGACQNIIERVVSNPDDTPVFTFLDEDDSFIVNNNNCMQIRTVIITMTVREAIGNDRMVERTYSSRIHLRNIGL
jgi:hypothetical protein